jgi:hypothetical protein
VGDVGVHGCADYFIEVVLYAREFFRDVSRVVVVDEGEGCDK